MVNNKYSGGKIMMKPAGSSLGQASVDRLGSLKFYGSDAINAEHLCHEWIHLCQRGLNLSAVFDLREMEGMLEFELVVFQDVIHYMRHGTIKRLDPGGDFPSAQQWISNLDVGDKEKEVIFSVYQMWIMVTFSEFDVNGVRKPRIPETIKDRQNYYTFANTFFRNSHNYKNRNFTVDSNYGVSTLETLLKTVRKHCFN